VAPRQRKDGGQPLGQVGAVGQAGEHVVVRQVLDARLGVLARGDVAQHAQPVGLVPSFSSCPPARRDVMAIFVHHCRLVGSSRARACIRPPPVSTPAPDLQGGVPITSRAYSQDREQRVVDIGDDAVLVEENPFVGGRGEFAHALLAVADRLLGELVPGDVGDHTNAPASARPRRSAGPG